MRPEEGALLIGMNAALYQVETVAMETWIVEGVAFKDYAENIRKYCLGDGEEYDDRQLYQQVSEEL